MTERLSVLLDWSEMDSIVSKLSHVFKHLWPSAHFSKTSGHDCHETELLHSNLLASSFHYWLNIDILWLGVQDVTWVDLILIG